MTSDKKIEGEGPMPAPGEQAASDPTEGQTTTEATASTTGATGPVAEVVARLEAEVAELKDRLLRTHAEMDNVRKRLEREKAETARFAISKFARDVVGIGDNVQRAIEALPHRSGEHDPAFKSFLEGVTMIERELLIVLERHGIRRLDPKGEPFNPHLHQAVMEMPVADVPSGTVTQVFQAGYTIEERVLRPAMVVVAKGGMKPQPTSPAEGSYGASPDDAAGAAASETDSHADGIPGDAPDKGGTAS